MNTRSMAKTMLSIEKKTCDFLILFGNWPTLLETKHIPHHLPKENHLPSNLWSGYVTVAWRASFQTMNFHRNTLGEFAPSQYKLRTKILEFCRSSKPPVARSRNPGKLPDTKTFWEFRGAKEMRIFLMSLSNPKQTSWLEEIQMPDSQPNT